MMKRTQDIVGPARKRRLLPNSLHVPTSFDSAGIGETDVEMFDDDDDDDDRVNDLIEGAPICYGAVSSKFMVYRCL